MSLASYIPVKVGDIATAANVNAPFTVVKNATATGQLDNSNFRNDCFDTNNIAKQLIVPEAGTVENSTSTIKTYTTTAYQLVDTGAIDMLTPNITVQDGDVLVFNWKCSIIEQRATTPALTHRARFQLHWRITGSGSYVQIPNSPTWAYSGYNWIKNSLYNQNTYINAAGSMAIRIVSPNVLITGIKLMVKPGTTSTDEVDLAQSSVSYILYRR